MAHRIAPRRLRLALRNTAAGLTLITAPVLMSLGVAGPGQAAQAATIPTVTGHFVLAVDGGAGSWDFSQARFTAAHPPKIVLKGSRNGAAALWSLVQAERSGTLGRVNFTLALYTGAANSTLVEEWDLGGARVSRLQISGLKAGGTSPAVMTVTIVANSVTIAHEP